MPHCSLLHKISSCTKFGSIIPCIVVEGVSRTAAGSVLRPLWQFFSISSSLNYAVVLDTPLVCCIYFFFLLAASLMFSRAILAPFSEKTCATLLSFDWPYVVLVRVIFVMATILIDILYVTCFVLLLQIYISFSEATF